MLKTLQVDDEVTANESMGSIESVKAVSELFSPVSGTVVRVNEELEDTPESINEQPFASRLVSRSGNVKSRRIRNTFK